MEISIIASSSLDNGIASWDLNSTGNEKKLLYKTCASPPHGLTVVGDKFLASSQLRNTTSTTGSIFFWSWSKPQVEVKSFPVESIKALVANSEGTYLVGGGASGDIYLWEVSTGKLLKKWHGHYRSVTCLVFSGDDSLLVSGSQDGSVRVWSLMRIFDDYPRQQGSNLYEYNFNEHTMSVTDIVVDYGGCNAMIVSASEDRTCKVWRLSNGKLLRNIIFPSAINALALDPSGSVFFAGGRDGKIYIGAINATKDYVTQVLGSVSEQSKAVTCLAYCTDGNLLISGSEDGKVCVWDHKAHRPLRNFCLGNGPVNNIQVVRKTIVPNSNKTQSSWKRHGSSLSIPPPLEKYQRSGEDATDGMVIVDPPPICYTLGYSSFLSADLINEQVKELQQQGSAATEMEMVRLKQEYQKSLQMNEQWQKHYDDLLQMVIEEKQNDGSN